MEDKTNVMRMLEQAGVVYTPHSYPHGKEAVDGVTVARLLGLDPQRVFKTLVTRGASGGFCVFVIPAEASLDLKRPPGRQGRRAWSCSMWRNCRRSPAMCGAAARPSA